MNVVKEKLFTHTDNVVFVLLTCLSASAIASFATRWFSFGDWFTHPGSFSILTFIVFFKLANSLARWFTLPLMRRPRMMPPSTLEEGLKNNPHDGNQGIVKARPEVAAVTTIVPGAESLEMLEVTLEALTEMDYPHDTWVLDEGDDEEVRALCRRCGALHFSRRNFPHYQTDGGAFEARSKHGNYNAWLHEIGFDRYEIITAFDPDHVPARSFLSQVLGYFADPAVGYVQAAQAYYNQRASFIARGAAEETYEYYSCTQMAAYNLGQPAVVGCHNTHRIAALREVGGFAAHDADDLLISLRYRAAGWRGVYVPQILARGVTPVDWNGYLTQQLRWARSVMDIQWRLPALLGAKNPGSAGATGSLLTNRPPYGARQAWMPALPGRALSALHSLFYLQNSLTTFVGLLLLAYMLATGDVPGVLSRDILPQFVLLCTALGAGAFYRQRFYLDARGEWGTHWRADLLRYAKWPVFIRALWEVVVGRRVPYALTRKVKAESRSHLLLIPHTLVILLLCGASGMGLLLGRDVPSLLYWVAAAAATTSLSLILTSRLHFPAPYDKSLVSSSLRNGAK